MKIIALTRRSAACDYYRVTLPMTYLKKESNDEYFFAYDNETVFRGSDVSSIDMLLFNRVPPYDMGALDHLRNTYKFKVVCDIDDYWELYQHHIAASNWNKEGMTKKILEAIKMSDVVTCTNDRLAEEISKIHDNVHILPNAMPFGASQFTPAIKDKDSNRIRFIYAGGVSHYFDLKTMENVFKRCRSDVEMKNNAEFVLAGYEDTDYWKKAYNVMANSGIVKTKGRKDLNNYMDVYNGTDVAIAPLENNKFNTYKSTLKLIEAGCKKIPLIASNMWPYLEDEEMHGKGIILCDKPADFMEAMKFFVKNPDKIKEMGNTLHNYVAKKYNLHLINEDRYKIFKSLLSV